MMLLVAWSSSWYAPDRHRWRGRRRRLDATGEHRGDYARSDGRGRAHHGVRRRPRALWCAPRPSPWPATLVWALGVESIIAALNPAVGKWLPFSVFDQVVSGEPPTAARPRSGLDQARGVPREPRLHRRGERGGGLHLAAPRRHVTAGPAHGAGGAAARSTPSDGPLYGQAAAAERILRALPDWFGIEQSILLDYAAAAEHPADVRRARAGRGPGAGQRGRRLPDPASRRAPARWRSTCMAVLPEQQRRGIGPRARGGARPRYARAEGLALLHVKTLGPSDPDPGYAATRAFYQAVGFIPSKELPQVWGSGEPLPAARAAALSRQACGLRRSRAARPGSLGSRPPQGRRRVVDARRQLLVELVQARRVLRRHRNFCSMSVAVASSSTCSAMNHCRNL